MASYKDAVGLGVAGNFALHLEQAGEIEDFKELKVADEYGPKGLFPFYLKGFDAPLGVYPLSSDTVRLPEERSLNVQAEPEAALICEIVYEDDRVAAIIPTHFAPYNDCSIRRPGANKISEKKNWGPDSKGIGAEPVAIDRFGTGGIMDRWHIASFLRRNGELHRYGEDAAMITYSYFHEKLLAWIVSQLNTQEDIGPLEPIPAYLKKLGWPKQAVISIGAMRYTAYGESTYLKPDDEVIVVVYDGDGLNPDVVMQSIDAGAYEAEGMKVLSQRVTA